MDNFIFIVIPLIIWTLGIRPIIWIFVCSFVGWLLCDIDITKEYMWYSGIWHGIFFVPNYIRYLIWDSPYKAEIYTNAYNFFYWIFCILSTIAFLFGGYVPRNR